MCNHVCGFCEILTYYVCKNCASSKFHKLRHHIVFYIDRSCCVGGHNIVLDPGTVWQRRYGLSLL